MLGGYLLNLLSPKFPRSSTYYLHYFIKREQSLCKDSSEVASTSRLSQFMLQLRGEDYRNNYVNVYVFLYNICRFFFHNFP